MCVLLEEENEMHFREEYNACKEVPVCVSVASSWRPGKQRQKAMEDDAEKKNLHVHTIQGLEEC